MAQNNPCLYNGGFCSSSDYLKNPVCNICLGTYNPSKKFCIASFRGNSTPLWHHTCEGALQERPPLISPIRAAAVGLLELMRTGPLISMEWRWGGGASMGLCDMVSEVKECRFLLFFFSPARCAPFVWGPEEAPSPESPLESDGLSNSISCRAAELNYKRGREPAGLWREELEVSKMKDWWGKKH